MLQFDDRFGRIWVISSALLSSSLVLLIGGFLLLHSLDSVGEVGLGYLSFEWNPARGRFGILPMLFGSVTVTLIALILAVPIGFLTAIWTAEILPPRFRFLVKSLLEILAGIPSIVYGLLGVATLSLWIEDIFDLESGRTVLTAGLLLAVMILPTMITLSDDALRSVPESFREARERARPLGPFFRRLVR